MILTAPADDSWNPVTTTTEERLMAYFGIQGPLGEQIMRGKFTKEDRAVLLESLAQRETTIFQEQFPIPSAITDETTEKAVALASAFASALTSIIDGARKQGVPENTLTVVGTSADKVIVDSIATYLGALPENRSVKRVSEDLDVLYQELQSRKKLPQDELFRLITQHFESLIASVPADIMNMATLTDMAPFIHGQGKNKERPLLLKSLVRKIESLVSQELTQHLLLQPLELAKLSSDARVQVYTEAYTKEFEELAKYLDFVKNNQSLEFDKVTQLAAAKRFVRLVDLLISLSKTYLPDWFSRVLRKSKSVESFAEELISSADPDFLAREQKQKLVLQAVSMYALPEDRFFRLQQEADKMVQELTQKQTTERVSALLEKLVNIDEELMQPLVTAGSTEYTLDDLLIDEGDIKRLDHLQESLTEKIVETARIALSQIAPDGKDLGPARKERNKLSLELQKVRDLLLSRPYFKQSREAQAVNDQITALLKATSERDEEERRQLVEKANRLTQEAVAADPEALRALGKRLDETRTRLEELMSNGEFSQAAAGQLADTLDQVSAWYRVTIVADAYHQLREDRGQEAVGAYKVLAEQKQAILDDLHYQDKELWQDQLTVMAHQETALRAVVQLLDQKSGTYALRELAQAVTNLQGHLEPIEPALAQELEKQGYIQKREEGWGATEKGFELKSIDEEQRSLERRLKQLHEFLEAAHKPGASLPQPIMKAGVPIPLAEELELHKLILDDKLSALKQAFVGAQRDPLKQLLVDLTITTGQRVNTKEEGVARLAELTGMTPKQLDNPLELSKKLGFVKPDAVTVAVTEIARDSV